MIRKLHLNDQIPYKAKPRTGDIEIMTELYSSTDKDSSEPIKSIIFAYHPNIKKYSWCFCCSKDDTEFKELRELIVDYFKNDLNKQFVEYDV